MENKKGRHVSKSTNNSAMKLSTFEGVDRDQRTGAHTYKVKREKMTCVNHPLLDRDVMKKGEEVPL